MCVFLSQKPKSDAILNQEKKTHQPEENVGPGGRVGSKRTLLPLQVGSTLKQEITTAHTEQKPCLTAMNLNCNSSNLNEKLFKKALLVMSPSGLC